MSALKLIDGGGEIGQDLIERIASALPEAVRADYYREMSHCRVLPECDEMLRILRAMQFLTLLIHTAPGEIASERRKIADLVTEAAASIESSFLYQRQIVECIKRMPEEISRGIMPAEIAGRINEDLRQRFAEIPETVRTLLATSMRMKQAASDFRTRLATLT